MKKIVAAIVAAGVLVSGALVTVAIAAPSAAAQEADAETNRAQPARSGIVSEVLDELVADGTLTSAQAEAIETALRDKAQERRKVRDVARRAANKGFRWGRLLADDVLDADELASFPEDHPLRDPEGPAAEYLDDGELTIDELRLVRQAWREARASGS